ncbi:unnamed protein product [Mycena citricolor]|uniref:RNA helicase n=1 Tax=Mycena citricolor TaxID=2018698 RepID=A0AAD2H8B7_9AGAR|nr:unnamed protein product [Mycena citricolor]CAK5271914.1 unnamed protein product [Mycena citricolor]
MQFGGPPPPLMAGHPHPSYRRRPSGPPLPQYANGPPGIIVQAHPPVMNPYYPPPWNIPMSGNIPAFHPRPDGWFVSQPPPNLGAFPMSPTATATSETYFPPSPSTTLVNTPGVNLPPVEDDLVHDFWKGRFAPFPGCATSPSLLQKQKTPSRGIPITAPSDDPLKPTPPNHTILFETSLSSPISSAVPSSTPGINENHINGKTSENTMLENDKLLDKYADVFVPVYLQKIQKQPHHLKTLPPIPPFPSVTYIRAFFPTSVTDSITSTSSLTPSSILSNAPPATAPALTTGSYHQHWAALLSWELHKLAVEKEQIVLWKVGVKIGAWDQAEFILVVPSIRENSPRLEIGDVILLREILEGQKIGSGIAFEGRVVALRKREGLIHFFCPGLKLHIECCIAPIHPARQIKPGGKIIFTPEDILPLVFNISFIPTARPAVLMDNAALVLHQAMSAPFDTHRRRAARRWLFPHEDDLVHSEMDLVQKHLTQESWTDGGLNAEQKLAVSSIVLHESPVPFLIHGPPGTGKTRTMVEAVLQILRNHPEATFAEVALNIRQYCYIEDDKFALPSWDVLLKYRVVVTSCVDAGILIDAHCTNFALARLETQLMGCLRPRKQSAKPVLPHWTHLLIDEAAQAAEPELLIPISVVLPGEASVEDTSSVVMPGGLVFGSIRPQTSAMPQLVLCGDPNQLGPIVAADAAREQEMDVSLLQRLFDRSVYGKNRDGRPRSSTAFRPYANLIRNYRSHPAILMPPSAIFYDDALIPCARNGTITWSGLPNQRFPLLFVGTETEESCVDDRASWYNPGEIDHTVRLIVALLSESASCTPPLHAAEIGVMAAFREQVWKIRERLRKAGLSAVDVGTVEDYQGREMRVCIISCVRSSTRFLKDDLARGLGLVRERKRMNVAITRAKELLVVVGNGSILKQDPFWRNFLQFMLRNKLYVGPALDLELDGNYISRLESALVSEEDLDEEERGVAIAGGMAREILKDEL